MSTVPDAAPRARHPLLLAAKVGVSVALLAYVLWKVDLAEALAQARDLSLGTIAADIGILLVYLSIAAARWHVVFSALGEGLSARDAVRITFVGAFFNQVLPGTVGADAARIWHTTQAGLGTAKGIHSVVLERLCNVMGVALLASVGLTFWRGQIPGSFVLPLWGIFAATVVIAIVLASLDSLPKRLRAIGLFRRINDFGQDSRALLGDVRSLALIGATVIANQVLIALVVWLIGRDLALPLSFADCFLLMPAVVLVSSLPVSVGGWGVREYAMVVAFGTAGVAPSSALLLSVLFALLNVAAALPGALLWLRDRRAA